MFQKVKKRLLEFGYCAKSNDEAAVDYSVKKVQNIIKNDCNVSEVPEGLINIAVDMAVGDFFFTKKTFAPDEIDCIDLNSPAVKQIQLGDTNTVFATGEGSLTDEQRLDRLINYLLTNGSEQFSCYRKLRW